MIRAARLRPAHSAVRRGDKRTLKIARILLFAIGLWSVLIGYATAQSSQPPNVQKTPNSEQQPRNEQHEAKPAPAIEPARPGNAQPETNTSRNAGPDDRKDAWLGWSLSDKIAIIAIIVGCLQFAALFATVLVMVRTARRQLRAYVLVEGAKLESWDSVDDPAIATVVIKNYGQTPAYSVDSFVGIGAHHYPLTIELKPPADLKTVKSILAPGGKQIFRVPALRPHDSDEIALISGGGAAVYVAGRIFYVDAFKKDRITNFLLFYGGEIGTAVDGLMGPYETGNDAT